MNNFLKKLIEQEFMTEKQGQFIEEAVMSKDSFIISGHKGWGILPLMAAVSGVVKSNFKIKQVKGFEDLKDEADYHLIADLRDIDYGKLVTEAILTPGSSFISLKDPDHPYSIFKLLGDVYKSNGVTLKVIQILECAKIDDEKKLSKITTVTMSENGKLVKKDL